MEQKTIKLHFKYCAAIMAAVIVLIATEKWSGSNDFTVYLSNAATMTSLMLAAVAIFYSFISNDSLSRSLGSISTVSSEMQGATHEISKVIESSEKSRIANETVISSMEGASSKIDDALETLDRTLSLIAEQNSELRSALAEIPSRIDKLEISVNDATKALSSPKPDLSNQNTADSALPNGAIDKFMSRSPLGCNLLSYAACLAAKQEKIVSIKEFCAAIETENLAYFSGYLVSMHSIGIIQVEVLKGKSREYKIKWANDHLNNKILPYFNKYLASNIKEPELSKWKERISLIEEMFK